MRLPKLAEGGLMVGSAHIAFAGIISLVIIHYAKRLLFHKQVRMPPGPLAWPLIGHIHLLADANRPLHQTLYDLARRYGHIILLHLGSCKVLVVTSSELARECLTTHDMNFASRPRFSGTEHLGYDCTMFGLNPYDRRCRNLRRICTSQLLSASRVESSPHIRREVSKLVSDLFQMKIKDEASAVVDMRSMMVDLMFNIILRSILPDRRYMGSAEELEEFKEMINTHFELLGAFNVGDYIPLLRWLDFQGCERGMKKLSRRRDEILQKMVDEYRLCMRKESDESLIDVLIHLVDKAQDFCSDDTIVKGTITSMILGATDTSANTTEWAISSLLKRPEALKRAQEELDVIVGRERVLDESDLPNLKYLEAIVKETLRLYPAGPLLIPHMAKEACTVGGYHVPAHSQLFVNVWGIHRDPAEWEHPMEFEPERFMKSSSPDVNGHDFKYMPFGYGRRACPGLFLAMRMLKLTLGKLLQSFDWSIPHGMELDMSEGRAVTLSKAVPLKAAIKPRLPHHLY